MELDKRIYKTNKNVCIEVQWDTNFYDWFSFRTAWTRRGSHAGFVIDIDVYSLFFRFEIYDWRHWDYTKDRFHTKKSAKEEYKQDVKDDAEEISKLKEKIASIEKSQGSCYKNKSNCNKR